MANLLLAHDLGTTGNKAVLFHDDGRILASAFRPYATQRPHVGWAEQNPLHWWNAVCETTQEIFHQHPEARNSVAAVSFSAIMNGCLLVDRHGDPVGPAIIHADVRSEAECRAIAHLLGARRLYEATGHQPSPHYTLGKLAWILRNEPHAVRRAEWCLQAKDYLAGRFTGVYGFTDPSDAALTGMYDLRAGTWLADALQAASIPPRILPQVVASATVVGTVTQEAAAATGLASGTPVVLGGGDGACATVGAGCVQPGDAYHYVGGTSWIASVAADWVPHPLGHVTAFPSLVPNQIVRYVTVQSAGSCIEWALDLLGIAGTSSSRYSSLEELADTAVPGSRDLYFLPYLEGARAPVWDANARGAFIGLTAAHTRAEVARSVYEGVALALAAALEDLSIPGEVVLRALGGGMRSRLWREIFSAVYRRRLHVLERLSEATACGAAVAAGIGVGLLPSWEEARRFAPIAFSTEPDARTADVYRSAALFFRTLYPSLAPHFAQLARR
ncbi:MAG: xylulokinase [Chthonomonadales bacterium]